MGDTWRRRGRDHVVPAGSSTGPFTLSLHAVERFRERVCAGLSLGSARRELTVLSLTAHRTTRRTRRGDAIWIATNGAAVQFVVRRDAACAKPICTTVYEADERVEDEEQLEVM